MKCVYGYIDSKIIGSGLLIPLYIDYTNGEIFTHILDESYETIIGFEKIKPNSFKRDLIVKMNSRINIMEGDESYLIVKFHKQVKVGFYTDIKNFFLNNQHLLSKTLIESCNRFFKIQTGTDYT